MNRGVARLLVQIYPLAWRERYGAEFAKMLEDGPGGLGAVFDVLSSALGERISPAVQGGEMAATSRLERWGTQAPWAVFGVAPVASLAAAYFVALMILWSGWQVFLPNEQTPFVRVDGWAVVWFGVGRMFYFGAPVLVSLCLAIVSALSRTRLLWPVLGTAAIALVNSVIQVRAVRPSLSDAGRVQLLVADWRPGYSAMVMACTLVVYLLLRIWQRRTQTA
jgi:hypothetical protein